MHMLGAEQVAHQVATWKQQWLGGTLPVPEYLVAFDEASLLVPRYRVIMPESFVCHQRAKWGAAKASRTSPEVAELYERADGLMIAARSLPPLLHDPLSGDPLGQAPPDLAGFVHRGSQVEARWSEWSVEIGQGDFGPIVQPRAFSFYDEWQPFGLWALLEKYTFRGLLDPRQVEPHDFYRRGQAGNLTGCLLRYGVGDPRPFELYKKLESDRWLEAMWGWTAQVNWINLAIAENRDGPWTAPGQASDEERWAAAVAFLRARVANTLPWSGLSESTTVEKLKALLAFYAFASERSGENLRKEVRALLFEAAEFAMFRFGFDERRLDQLVGPCEWPEEVTFLSVARPQWTRAVKALNLHLPYIVEELRNRCPELGLEERTASEFLDYVERKQLYGWASDFAELVERADGRTDLIQTHHFLRLRSLALSLEPLVVQLSIDFGTEEDRGRAVEGSTKDRHKALLCGGRGWPERTWQLISQNWRWTQSSPEPLRPQIEALDLRLKELVAREGMSGELAAHVLRQVFLRHVGGHRGDHEVRTLLVNRGDFLASVVWSAIIYWRAAQVRVASEQRLTGMDQ